MFSAFPRFLAAATLSLVAASASGRELKVCADPNNMPFSDQRGEGFENRIAKVVAQELGATVSYTWWAQRRGFVRNTLNAGLCDLVPGIAAHLDMLSTSAPYYRSSYAFVTRSADHLAIRTLDDPRLRDLRIGVQLIGDDGANSPPVHALARRGIVGNLRGFPVYGDYAEADPAAPIVHAVADGSVDVAVVWGPVAGYFAARQDVALDVTPLPPEPDASALPMAFDIAMGVRKSDRLLHDQIDAALARRSKDIAAILAEYHVPRVDTPQPDQGTAR